MGADDHRVVMGLLRRGDQVLLVHRRADRRWYPDAWDLPGGHIDPGEHPTEALVRELSEELGVDIDRPTQPPMTTFRVPTERLVGMVWIIDSWRGDVTNRAQEEHDAVGWFTVDDLGSLQLVDQSLISVLEEALAGL